MQTHRIETPRTVRFFTLGDPARCCEVWYLLHGYGQTGEDFLRACEPLACDGRVLVAPDALSRFYLRGGRGPVGASWMTGVEREDEIADYLRFLDGVAAKMPTPGEQRHLCVVGFSQGAATAFRWAALGATHVDRLILWGAGVPPDLDLAEHRERLRGMRIALVHGTRDEEFDERAMETESARLAGHELPHDCHVYDGAHELDGVTLRALADR